MNLHLFTRDTVPSYITDTLGIDACYNRQGFAMYRCPLGTNSADPELEDRLRCAVAGFATGNAAADHYQVVVQGRELYRNGFGIAGAELIRYFVLICA